MGVKGLWEVVAPAGKISSFSAHIAEQFEALGRPMRLGIDASIWFYEFSNALRVGHASSGENPELRSLFFRLTKFYCQPVTLLFVFDGPERPRHKRDKSVKTHENWIAPAFRKFLDAFGFDYHNALGEAEAELALLNRLGLIDAVLTEDSDIFVFGATCVLRGGSKIEDQTTIYRAETISHSEVGMGQAGFLLMAILCGGDYDTAGLQGCAHAIAYKLAQCGFGDSLYDAVTNHDGEVLQAHLEEWRNKVKTELLTDSCKVLGRRYATLASRINVSFPCLKTVQYYTTPLVTQTPLPPNHSTRRLGQKHMDPARLAWLCSRYFGWSDTSKRSIADVFVEKVWPGAGIRAMTVDTVYSGIYYDLAPSYEQSVVAKVDSLVPVPVTIDTSFLHERMIAGITRFKLGSVGSSSVSSDSDAEDNGHNMVMNVDIPAFVVKSFHNRIETKSAHPELSDTELGVNGGMAAGPSRSGAAIPGSSANNPITLFELSSVTTGRDANNGCDQDIIDISSGSLSDADDAVIILD